MQHAPRKNAGFALVELSIIIVVIGLTLGGIFIARDLMKSSVIRGTIAQKGSFDTAVETFKLKYEDYMPGDLPPPPAAIKRSAKCISNFSARLRPPLR